MNILITGGASGLGEAITKALAKNVNDTVYFTYNSSMSKAEVLEEQFSNTVKIKCDFKNQFEVNSLSDKISEFDLDVIINNVYSGEHLKTYFHKILPNDFTTDFVDNLLPTIILTQSAIAFFRKKKKGKIITILTSSLLNTPQIGASVYTANKAYLGALVKSWATENVKFNITSNSVSPSLMQTTLTSGIDERMIEQIRESHPLQKLLTVDEVAETVLFLSNASPQINGVDIVMNAGTNIK